MKIENVPSSTVTAQSQKLFFQSGIYGGGKNRERTCIFCCSIEITLSGLCRPKLKLDSRLFASAKRKSLKINIRTNTVSMGSIKNFFETYFCIRVEIIGNNFESTHRG